MRASVSSAVASVAAMLRAISSKRSGSLRIATVVLLVAPRPSMSVRRKRQRRARNRAGASQPCSARSEMICLSYRLSRS
jgi:hypothetical protein